VKQLPALAALLLVAPAFETQAAEITAAARTRGAQLFTHRCGMCHREGGTGTFTLARRLGKERSLLEGRTDLQPEYVRYVVRWGLVNMPRISRVELSDAELDAVIGHLAEPQR
jgi:mono/diheme cytochrome c family protein